MGFLLTVNGVVSLIVKHFPIFEREYEKSIEKFRVCGWVPLKYIEGVGFLISNNVTEIGRILIIMRRNYINLFLSWASPKLNSWFTFTYLQKYGGIV